MFAPPFRRVSPSPRLPSVQPWFLRYALLIAVLFTVATSAKDLCPNNQADFPKVVHTIGPIDGHLWAITKDDNWTVFELTPCKADNDSLVRCMEVGDPVAVHTKWHKLVEAVQEARNSTDLNFSVNNSFVMDSKDFNQTLAMHDDSFTNTGNYFGYVFDTNETITTQAASMIIDSYPDLWFSSDIKDKAYRLLESGKKIQVIKLGVYDGHPMIDIAKPEKKICNTGSTEEPVVKFVNETDKCDHAMNWTLSKAVQYQNKFYFFASDKVYIFSGKAETEPSKVQVMSYTDFLHCKAPTTLPPRTTHSNETKAPPKSEATKAETNPVTKAAKENGDLSGYLVLIIFSIVILFLVVFIPVYCCWWKKRDTTEKKSEKSTSEVGTAEPKAVEDPVSAIESKVLSKVPKENSKVGRGSMTGSKTASKTKVKGVSKVKGAKASSNAMKSNSKGGSKSSLGFSKFGNKLGKSQYGAPKGY